ncbi:hypothetical protein [Brevundimonas sp.]|uniref:hypothetical protein n=1 Tax=Brevundimonas sp. TaxID=1871086 RepID=UPI0025D9442E|nr:hypothetical protein [Brevundimonas sp.]
MAPLLLALTIHGLQEAEPPPAPADLYRAPAVRPYEMPPEESDGLNPLPPVPELPEPTPIEAFDPPGPTDELDRLFLRRIDAMRALADGDAGPFDGEWIVSDATGRPLYALILSDPAPGGGVEGAWRDLTAPEGAVASGVFTASSREGDRARLWFADGRVLTLSGAGEDLNGRPVRLARP